MTGNDMKKKIILTLIAIAITTGIACSTLSPYSPDSGKITACLDHGGVNCGAGPDIDGSVVCADNYRNSDVAYTDACSGLPN